MKFIFKIIYYYMLLFRRKKLEEKFREINSLPGPKLKNGDWILNGLIAKLNAGDELGKDEKSIIALLLVEYSNISVEVSGGLHLISMSTAMYRDYLDYANRQYIAREKKKLPTINQ